MKNLFENLDKILEHRTRLQIMSVLVANETYDYTALKELLNITDGNLATNIKALERENYLVAIKSFILNKPNTRYAATEKGRVSFQKHLTAMEELIKQQRQ